MNEHRLKGRWRIGARPSERYRERTKGPKGTPGTSLELSFPEASAGQQETLLVDCGYE
jgi:hypothetical protein